MLPNGLLRDPDFLKLWFGQTTVEAFDGGDLRSHSRANSSSPHSFTAQSKPSMAAGRPDDCR
jgi:hypothetical protein